MQTAPTLNGARKTSDGARLSALRGCALFRYIADDELRDIAAEVTLVEFAKGAQILGRQTGGAEIYCMVDGVVLANQFSASGREVGYRRLAAGSYFGEIAAIDGLLRSVNVTAINPVRIARMPEPLVRGLLGRSLGFNRALLEDLATLVRNLSDRLLNQNALSAAGRLRAEIVRMALMGEVKDNSATIASAPSHAEIAALIGTQREAVTREYNRLEAAGLIVRTGRHLVVPDIEALDLSVEKPLANGPPAPR